MFMSSRFLSRLSVYRAPCPVVRLELSLRRPPPLAACLLRTQSWVVRELVEAGYTVRACVRDTSNADKTQHLVALNERGYSGSVQLWQADLNVCGSYDAPFAGCAGVVHTGAVISSAAGTVDEATGEVRGRKYTPQEVYSGCFTEVKHLLQSVRRGGARRCVFTSSCAAVLHPQPGSGRFEPGYVFTEKDWCLDHNPAYQAIQDKLNANDGVAEELQDPANGGMAYCLAKASTERYIYAEAEQAGTFDCVSIMPMHVIGPCMAPNHDMAGTWQNCIRGMMEGKVHPKGWGPSGQMAWNLVDVRDTAQLHRLCLEHPAVGNGCRYISAASDPSGLMATHELQEMLGRLFPLLEVAGEVPRSAEDGGGGSYYPETPRIMETYSTLAIETLGLRTRPVDETVRIESLCMHLPRHGDSIIVCDRCARRARPTSSSASSAPESPSCDGREVPVGTDCLPAGSLGAERRL
jgi:nucleoside-diphosphate-sugar epimerase